MKNMNPSEASATAALLESVLQSFAVGGGELTGTALVAALEPGAIDPAVASAYLKLRAA